MAMHHIPASDDNQAMPHSTLAWASRAGVLLDPQPMFGANLGRFEQLRAVSQQLQPQPNENGSNMNTLSDTESNPSVDSFMPLPGLRQIPPTLVPEQRTDIPVQRIEAPVEIGQHDSSFDQMEHHQAREQSRLLERFKLLKQWQQQQQEKLVRQQHEQLEMLRSEQHRVHQVLLAQRQKQWGAGHVVKSPPRSSSHQHSSTDMPSSPQRVRSGGSSGMSSLPQALAKGTLSLSQNIRPQALNTLLNGQIHLPTHPSQEVDLDTASEANSSIAEEGVYPLPETASEISDEYSSQNGDMEARQVEDHDAGRDADMEDGEVTDDGHHTEEFTPEEDEHTPVKKSPVRGQSPPRSTPPRQHVLNQDTMDEEEILGDERPIRPGLGGGAKTFEELIEEQMRLEQEKQQRHIPSSKPPRDQPAASPGRKFLRRGQGMARFGKISRKPPSRRAKEKPLQTKEQKSTKGVTEQVVTVTDVKEKSTELPNVKPNERLQSRHEQPQPLSRKVAIIRQSVPNYTSVPAVKPKPTPLSRSAIDKEKLPNIYMTRESQQQANQYLPTEGVHPDDTIEMSFRMRMQEWEQKAEEEKEELDEFELLEEAADDNASFSSNASLVVNMMKRTTVRKQTSLGALSENSNSLQSSQEQPVNQQSHDQSHDRFSSSSSESDDSDLDRTLKGDVSKRSLPVGAAVDGNQPVSLTKPHQMRKIGSSTEDDSDLGAVDAADYANNRTDQDASSRNAAQRKSVMSEPRHKQVTSNVNNSHSNYAALDDPNNWRHRQEDSDDVVSDGVIEEDNDSKNETDEEQDEDGVKKAAGGTSSHALDVDFEDEESWGDLGNAASGDDEDSDDDSIIAGLPVITSTPPVHSGKVSKSLPLDRRKADIAQEDQVTESPPTSKLVSKLFPKLKPVVPKLQQQQEKQQEESLQKATERPIGDGVQSKVLRDKLAELENEIERFRKENAVLAKLREDREKSLASLQAEIDEFQKQKTEELQKLQEFKEEEMKKLRREKKNFEKYQKATRAMPDKKDRTEIELLKNQLSDLQEELNKRESRWQANNARMRTRMEMLETENKELGEEVEQLQDERRETLKKEERKAKSNAAKSRARQLAELESARLASFPTLPRVNVTSSSSSEEDEVKKDKSQARQVKPTRNVESLEEVRKANASKSVEMPRTTSDGDLKRSQVGKKNGMHGEGNAKMKSPPRPGRVTSGEEHHTRRSEDQDDPASQPRVLRKRSVHFNVSPDRHNSSPVHTTQPSPHKSPAASTWNLEHPAVSHDTPTRHMHAGSNSSSGDSKKDEEDQDSDEEQIHHPDGKVEHIAPDGSRVITFRNGTRKEISADGQSIIVTFFNGDMKQIMPDERVVYYYSETGTTHTTYPDGLEILQFPNNQTEKHYPDGTKEITFPDQTIKYLFPNGNEESVFADGTILRMDKNGEKTMEFPNGQREIHTKQYKKREYPDGSVKTVYMDGRQETRYSNGRIRVKDKDGTVILDKTC